MIIFTHNIIHFQISAATLSGISSALVCIVFMWIPTRSSKLITVCCLMYTALSAYIIMLAAQSPDPILKGSTLGSTLVVSIDALQPLDITSLAFNLLFVEKEIEKNFNCFLGQYRIKLTCIEKCKKHS